MIKIDPSTASWTPENQQLEHLLARLAKGETEALESLYHMTHASVFGLALSFVRQQQDAEDVTHDTYVTLHRAAGRYEARGKPLAWILTITKNLALMRLRERKRQSPLSELQEASLTVNNMQRPVEDRLVMQIYLDELRDEEKTIVVLRAVSGWKHREIARFMSMPVQHVIVKYNRAIRKLARKYEESLRHIEKRQKNKLESS